MSDKPIQCIEKQRDYFGDQSPYSQNNMSKTMVFPVVMYGCEKRTIKKPWHQRIDAFELWCWRTPLRVPWIARRSNQSILKEISPEYSLEGLMLKSQYFGHMMWRTDALEKNLMLGKIEGERRRGRQRMRMVGWHHWFDGHEFEQAPGNGQGQWSLVCCSPWGWKSLTRLSNWTTEAWISCESLMWWCWLHLEGTNHIARTKENLFTYFREPPQP